MFPSSNQIRKQSNVQAPLFGKTEPKSPNPMGLIGTQSDPKSPPPSPKSQKHVGQMVPSAPVELQKDEKKVPKRIQMVQLQVNIEKTDIKNTTQNLKGKVDTVFEAFAKMQDQDLVDNRKGTVPVFTLPEFFWSDYKSNLTESQQETLIQDIETKAKDPQFEGSVFVLGTMVTAYTPKSLSAMKHSDLTQIKEALGNLSNLTNMEKLDFDQVYAEAMSPGVEDCTEDRHEARALLATVGDMLNARLDKAGIPHNAPPEVLLEKNFDRDQEMKDILDTVKTMAENRDVLASLALLPNNKLPNRTKMNQIVDLVKNENPKAAMALLKKLFGKDFPPQAINIERTKSIAAFFEKMQCDKKSITTMCGDFRRFYFSKSASNGERNKFKKRLLLVFNKSKLKLSSPSSMYKRTENKAMVVEGGPNGKVGFVHKLLPSHVDQPSYFQHRDDTSLIPQKLQSKRILANPQTEEPELGKRIKHFGVTSDNFLFESPKTGISLGVAICRDYSDGVYKDHFDQHLQNDIDHLQIVSAGVPNFKDHHGHFKTSVGLNDGLGSNPKFSTDTTYGNKGDLDLQTDVVQYDPKTDQFSLDTQGRGFKSKGMDLQDKSFTMGLSRPTHLQDAPLSEVESFTSTTNQGSVNLMQKVIKDHQSSLDLAQKQLPEVTNLIKDMTPIATQLRDTLMEMTLDNEARDKFNKENQDPELVYQPKVDHKALTLKATNLHQKLKPFIDQVNKSGLLAPEDKLVQPKIYGDLEGQDLLTALGKQELKLKGDISDSLKIIKYNQESLDRITVDRLRSQQLQLV